MDASSLCLFLGGMLTGILAFLGALAVILWLAARATDAPARQTP